MYESDYNNFQNSNGMNHTCEKTLTVKSSSSQFSKFCGESATITDYDDTLLKLSSKLRNDH